jgi:hypothetical protein
MCAEVTPRSATIAFRFSFVTSLGAPATTPTTRIADVAASPRRSLSLWSSSILFRASAMRFATPTKPHKKVSPERSPW